MHLIFAKRQHFFQTHIFKIWADVSILDRVYLKRQKYLLGDIPHDPLKQNVFASVLAEALCKDKSKAEIADMMRFLQILCSLMKSYMI